MTFKVFSAPSVTPHDTMTSRGANTNTGRNGVCLFYEQLMKALPDLQIETQRQHVTDDAILVEVVIRGTHLGGAFQRPGDESSLSYAVCTPSTSMTVSPGKQSTATGARCCDSWAFSTSRKACWDESPFWRLIPRRLRVLSRGHSCEGD
jgi:hypothetical protein